MKKTKKKPKKPKPAKTLSPFDCHRILLESHLHSLNVLERILPIVENQVENFCKKHPRLVVTIDVGKDSSRFNKLELRCENESSAVMCSHGRSMIYYESGTISKKNRHHFHFLAHKLSKLTDISIDIQAKFSINSKGELLIFHFNL